MERANERGLLSAWEEARTINENRSRQFKRTYDNSHLRPLEVKDFHVHSPSTSPSTSSCPQHEPNLNREPRLIRSRPSRSYAESPDSALQKEKPDKRHRREYAKDYRKCQRAKVCECQELKQRIQQLEQQIKSRGKDLKNAKNQLKQLNTYIDSIIQLQNSRLHKYRRILFHPSSEYIQEKSTANAMISFQILSFEYATN